jgi:diguanylate cyclase (GGDEF)-like protein/putative nucleotidyltransferase with HDIG domain
MWRVAATDDRLGRRADGVRAVAGRRLIRRWWAPAIASLLAAASVAVVVWLQHRADGYRRAQVTLANVKAQFTLDAVSPLQLVDGLAAPENISANMQRYQRAISSELAGLRRDWPTAALAGVLPPVSADFDAVNQIRNLLSGDPAFAGATNILRGIRLGQSANMAGDTANAAMARATQQYAARASRAETQSNIGTIVAVAALLACFLVFYRRWQRLLLATRRDARTDSLTGLGNRRALVDDLTRELRAADERPLVLSIYDLDGFKRYNDTFGHVAGDALLGRVATRLDATVRGLGCAYRMGGDEFCCLARIERDQLQWLLARGSRALRERGDGFEIGCSAGSVVLPDEATELDSALQLADQRMYAEKSAGPGTEGRQAADALLEVLRERDASLRDHTNDVADLAEQTARVLGMTDGEIRAVRTAAELHDVGKSAIPDAILTKPGKLSADEWELIRNHTLIGERIIRAAPALAEVAEVVRASHERVDGTGYPDGIHGDQIPLGARIVAVCDAFDAMIAERPYRTPLTTAEALAELRRCSGAQFDGAIVDAVCTLLERRRAARDAA